MGMSGRSRSRSNNEKESIAKLSVASPIDLVQPSVASINFDVHLPLDEKCNRKLNEIGGRGCFQWFAFFSIVLGMNCTGFFFYQLGYLLQ